MIRIMETKDFYYQIKGKTSQDQKDNETGLYGGIQNWVFPPIFSGRVSATDKKYAKVLIEEEYGRAFPLKVLAKDLKSSEFLLSIQEITDKDARTQRLFETNICIQCSKEFKTIDLYNDMHESYKGSEYCSYACKNAHYKVQEFIRNQERNMDISGNKNPVIYKITNKTTNKCYIGKTTQVFTLRWYQHFFQNGNCKFHEAVKTCNVVDWTFEVVEAVLIPDDIKTLPEIEKIILDRERYFINLYDSIENGYNSRT